MYSNFLRSGTIMRSFVAIVDDDCKSHREQLWVDNYDLDDNDRVHTA